MRGKKFLALFVSIVMLIGLIPITSIAATTDVTGESRGFSDMPNDWSTTALQHAVDNKLFVGSNGMLHPTGNLTRAEMATIITRAFNASVKGDISSFKDVKSTDWYADYIAKAYQMGIIKGSDGLMKPTASITRQEVFVILARAMKLQPATKINKTFSDVSKIADWAKGELYAMINAGYIQGSNGKLNPTGLITRAEFAQVMYNVLKHYVGKDYVASEVTNGNVMINIPGVTLKDTTIKGDLIIGDGVGDGEVILDNVIVTGRMVVRGGGENSIIIKGTSDLSTVIVTRIDGKVSIKVQGDANVEVIYIDDGSDDVNIQGTVGDVQIIASDITVNAVGATIKNVDIQGEKSKLIVDKASTITNVIISDDATDASVSVSGTVSTITTTASGTEISGDGKVEKVEVKSGAADTSIDTPNTQITVAAGVTGVTGGGGAPVAGGTTETNNTSGNDIVKDPEPDNGGSTGGGGYTPPPVVNVSGVSVASAGNVTVVGIGKTIQMSATITPENATIKTVTWSVINGTGSATIDSNGLLTATKAGNVTVVATANNTIKGQFAISVGAIVTDETELLTTLTSEIEYIFINGTIGSGTEYTAYEITKPVTIQGMTGAKVYGSFIIKTNGVKIDGLTIYTRGGGNGPLKNAIDVIAMNVTITNNTFELPNPDTLASNGGVGNGVTVWPNGDGEANYNITNNTFKAYRADTLDWSSTALQIVEGLELSRFDMAGVISKTVFISLDDEKALALGNTYENCSNNYIRSNWESGIEYKFVLVSTADQFSSAIEYAGNNAMIILSSDISGLNERITIDKSITIDGMNKILSFTDVLNEAPYGFRHGILISANDVTIKNLIIEMSDTVGWQGLYGIQVYGVIGVTLSDVTATGADGGILINGAGVSLTGNINISGNEFGGIEVSKGTALTASSQLKITGTLVNETEAYAKPTLWVIKDQGSVTGAVPVATNTTINTEQIQYYLVAINAIGSITPPYFFVGMLTNITIDPYITEDSTTGQIASFDTIGRTPVQVTLNKGTLDYSNVRIIVECEDESVKFIAQDTAGDWYNIAKSGWGPEDGFVLQTATTDVYVVVGEPGVYEVTIKLVDVSNGSSVLAAMEVNIIMGEAI